jgi:hypothetical protein
LQTTSPELVAYDLEQDLVIQNNAYMLNDIEILPASGIINQHTFIDTYRYFSNFYWKFIGESTSNGSDSVVTNGLLFWYIDVVLEGEIEY